MAHVFNHVKYVPYAIENAAGAIAVNRSFVAALTFLVWDIIITLEDEVNYVWSRSWSLILVLYFYVRYVPMLVQISILLVGSELTPLFHFTPHDCYIWQVFQGVAAITILASVDTILILRIRALYDRNPFIKSSVVVLFVLEMVALCLGLALAIPHIQYDNICLVTHRPLALSIYGGAAIAFQFIMFLLTVYWFIVALRTGSNRTPLIQILVRDGVWAFFLLFAIYVGELGLFGLRRERKTFSGLLYGWLISCSSFCGYRLLLNTLCYVDTRQPPRRWSNRSDPLLTSFALASEGRSNSPDTMRRLRSSTLPTVYTGSSSHATLTV